MTTLPPPPPPPGSQVPNVNCFAPSPEVSEDDINKFVPYRRETNTSKPVWTFGSYAGQTFLYWGFEGIDWHYVADPVPNLNFTRLVLKNKPGSKMVLEIGMFGIAQEVFGFCDVRAEPLTRLAQAMHDVWHNRAPTAIDKALAELTNPPPARWQKKHPVGALDLEKRIGTQSLAGDLEQHEPPESAFVAPEIFPSSSLLAPTADPKEMPRYPWWHRPLYKAR